MNMMIYQTNEDNLQFALPAEGPEGSENYLEFFIRAILSDGTEHFHYATEMFSIPPWDG